MTVDLRNPGEGARAEEGDQRREAGRERGVQRRRARECAREGGCTEATREHGGQEERVGKASENQAKQERTGRERAVEPRRSRRARQVIEQRAHAHM